MKRCATLLRPAAIGSKAGCVQHMEAGSVTRFNPKHDYPQGCTDYERWKHATVGLHAEQESLQGRRSLTFI